ncbi:MAG: 50S ribosomal protein L6 [Planctomycetaceae bacterium]|nr:50S ribosomal protein L6 [Planctomycetaceae bacterium]
MSRVGKAPIAVPKGIDVSVSGSTVKVKGKAGELVRQVAPGIDVKFADGVVTVSRKSDSRRHREMHGTTRALIQNMVQGVEKGFQKALDIIGVGWNAKMKGKQLSLQIGFCHTVDFEVPAGVKVALPSPQRIEISGIDKQIVGQFAAIVRKARPPEPYKGKGIRYEGEYVIRKVGKSQVGK